MDVNKVAFAFVPAEKLISAYIFISLGMVLPSEEKLCTKRLCYRERSILLVKLIRGGETSDVSGSAYSRYATLCKLKYLVDKFT